MRCNPECQLRQLFIDRIEAERAAVTTDAALMLEAADELERERSAAIMDALPDIDEALSYDEASRVRRKQSRVEVRRIIDRSPYEFASSRAQIASMDARDALDDEETACPRSNTKPRPRWLSRKVVDCEHPARIARAAELQAQVEKQPEL